MVAVAEETQVRKGPVPHLPGLDGLRGVAVLGVLAFHLGTVGSDSGALLGGGWLGVDVFFTLSGFLITSLLLAEAGAGGRIDLVSFWRRRVRRLQPAALLAVAAITAGAVWWAPAGTGRSVREQGLSALGGIANWHLLWADRPYAAGGQPSAFEHFWSLAVEEQFYVAWPLVVTGIAVLLHRRGRTQGLAGVVRVVAAVGILVSWVLLARHDLQRGYLGTESRMGAILLGAVLATALPLGSPAASGLPRRLAGAAGWVGLAVTAVLWAGTGWPPRESLALVLPLQGLASVGILLGLTQAPASAPARVLASGPLAALGRVSYGVYLWHWPVFVVLTPNRLGMGEAATGAVRLVVTAALVAASYRLVERPVRIGAIARRTRIALPAAALAVLLVVVVGARGVAPEPAYARADGSLVTGRSPVAAAPLEAATEHRPQRVLVVGDSIATSVVSGPTEGLQPATGHLFDHLADRGIAGAAATITGCPVLQHDFVADGEPNRTCGERLRRRIPEAVTAFRPDLVLWYSRQEAYPFLHDGSVSSDQAELRRRYAEQLRWFGAQGAKVLLVSPGPNGDGWGWNAPDGRPESMDVLDRTLTRVAEENPDVVVGVVRMAELLCGGAVDGCADRGPGGGRYRIDGVHFLGPEEQVASEWLAERIAEVRLPEPQRLTAP